MSLKQGIFPPPQSSHSPNSRHWSSAGFLLLSCILACLMFSATGLNAQVNTGTLSGLVLDPSGAAIASATISIKSPDTGYTRSIQSASDGAYTLPNLPIGNYDLTVAAPGFSGLQERVTVDVGERARRDLHLTIGSTGQTVEVQSSSSLSLDDASIGTVVTNETISETPLFLRNWDDLLRTVPGVQINRYTNQSGATSAGRTGDFNVNGVHSLQNNFILDGIDNNTFSENVQELSTESAHPSVDVIAEFNVITNPYSAEYGRSPGAVVSVNTKTGTNQFHGTAYEYVRNQFFDAFDYFSKQSLAKKAEDNQNQFGGSIGGPVMQNKLFFFFNFEDTRVKQGVSRIATVPLDNERIGDFSPAASAVAGVAPYPTLLDPASCTVANTPSSGGCSGFTNNQIPADRIDTSVAALMALFPEPNFKNGGASFPETNNYTRTGGLSDINASYDARVDWTPTQADTVFARFNYFNRTRDIPGYLGGLADGSSTSAWGNQTLKGASAVLGWTRILNPRLVNDFRFGWVRDFSKAVQQPYSLTQFAGQFVPGIPEEAAIGGGVPLTSFTNGAFEGSPDYLPKQQVPMLYQYNDTLSWAKHNHNLKFGVTIFAPMRNIFQDEPGTRGDLGFTGAFTGYGKPLSGPGASYADGLLGDTESDQLTNVFFVDQRLWMASGFVEDDWKVTPKFTLNLGLRYDFATPAMEGRNRLANFDPDGAGSLVFATGGSVGNRTLVNPSTTSFAPRVGATYALTKSTVLRAGYGIYYTVLERFGSEDQLALNPPNLINKALASTVTPVLKPSVGFPTNFLDPTTIDLTNLTAFHIRAVNPNVSTPRVQQWSVGVQQQITPNWIGEVDYVGTHSDYLDILRNYNQVEFAGNQVDTTQSASGTKPYANFGQIEYMDSIGRSNYSGLQASLNHTMNKGFSFRLAYTYAHSLDNTPEEEETNSGDAPNGRNYAAWYGNSDFDVRQRVSANYVYELPFGHGKPMLQSGVLSWIAGNWRTSGVYTFYSGHPFQATWSSDASYLDAYGFTTAVPNQVAPVHYLHKQTCWFYDAANSNCAAYAGNNSTPFVDPGKYVIGNVGRNPLVGPQTQLFDLDLIKQIPIHDRLNAEFRWEVFNLFNHTIFGQPSGNASSGSAASITTLSADPRVMQFAARISF
jgi:hypothetical protein